MARTAAASGSRIEYGLIAGIAVAIIAAVNGLGSQVNIRQRIDFEDSPWALVVRLR